MAAQYGFYHNNDICIGCKTCVIACKDRKDLPLGEKYRRVYDYGGALWSQDENGACIQENLFVYSVSIACMHCAAPACMAVCPVNAIVKRDDGIVYIDAEVCIGCGSCAPACPYGAPYVSATSGVAQKCDFCMDLIDNEMPPVCVAACPMRCLNYGDLESLGGMYGDVVNQVAPLSEDSSTGPSVAFTRSRLNPNGSLPGEILNAPEEIESATV
jgi:anaerobic dimethyl sulfoxide reductase subunit B (iron-sulfur subunit)